MSFQDAVRGLMAGDFSRLAPLFDTLSDGSPCPVIKWYEGSLFEPGPDRIRIIEALLNAGANVSAADHPSGDESVDEVLRRHGATR